MVGDSIHRGSAAPHGYYFRYQSETSRIMKRKGKKWKYQKEASHHRNGKWKPWRFPSHQAHCYTEKWHANQSKSSESTHYYELTIPQINTLNESQTAAHQCTFITFITKSLSESVGVITESGQFHKNPNPNQTLGIDYIINNQFV